MVYIPRRRFARLCFFSPLAGILIAGCQQTDEIVEDTKQTAIAAVQQTAISIQQTAEAEIAKQVSKLPELPRLTSLFAGLPMAKWTWNNGFGANSFAKNNQSLYTQTSGLHNGLDFGNVEGTPVIAQVKGTLITSDHPNDASPNVEVKSDKYHIIYGHTQLSSKLTIGQEVDYTTEIGNIVFQKKNNHHLHLGVRIADRAYNPIYFFPKSVVEGIVWSDYEPGEDAWSMKSFLYKSTAVANYWKDPNDPNLGIER